MSEEKDAVIEVNFSPIWDKKDRLQKMAEGLENSIDEIIVAMHQELKLAKMADEKLKASVNGRVESAESVRTLMNLLDDTNQKLGKDSGDKFQPKKDFNAGRAEQNAKA